MLGGSEKPKDYWFDEYQKLIAKPTKVGEAMMYVQADLLGKPKIVAVE